MDKTVIGVYEAEREVVAGVETLKAKGYEPEEITMVANDSEETSWIRKETNVSEETSVGKADGGQDGDDSFWEKVKSAFSSEDKTYNHEKGYVEKFKALGFSEKEAHDYDSHVRDGKIVVLVPEKGNSIREGGTSELTDYGNNLSEADTARRARDNQ